MLLHQLGTEYGLPVALYGDRLNVFVRNDRHWSLEEQLRGERDPTHFGQMLRELGIGYIAAGSPQAKGRIERLWRTLQDRLTVELRLRGIATLAAANAFLPTFRADFNRRFAHAPTDAQAAWRAAPRDLATLLSCRYVRTLGRDHVVQLADRTVQLPRGSQRRAPAGTRLELRECVDGRVLVFRDHTLLTVQPSPGPEFTLSPRYSPSRQRQSRRRRVSQPDVPRSNERRREQPRTPPPSPAAAAPSRSPRRPAPTHPWRHTPTYEGRAQRRTRTRSGVTFSLSS
jgi:hypothetical protein